MQGAPSGSAALEAAGWACVDAIWASQSERLTAVKPSERERARESTWCNRRRERRETVTFWHQRLTTGMSITVFPFPHKREWTIVWSDDIQTILNGTTCCCAPVAILLIRVPSIWQTRRVSDCGVGFLGIPLPDYFVSGHDYFSQTMLFTMTTHISQTESGIFLQGDGFE